MPHLAPPLERELTEERMDSPTIPEPEHRQALAGLRRINRVSRTAAGLLPAVVAFARRRKLTTLRLLDVASGGGDVPIALATLARGAGLHLELTLFDRSDVALACAQETAAERGIGVQVIAGDATRDLPQEGFDVATSCLFMHHLKEIEVIAVLHGMARAAGGLVLVSDLRRSRRGLWMAHVACRVLSRSAVVHFDGPASVRAAWTMEELADLAGRAGLSDVSIQRQWPGRMLLEWERR
ncbi:MAG: methyltransferase domain-containing protein [Tepidisphaeraceae bacterium]